MRRSKWLVLAIVAGSVVVCGLIVAIWKMPHLIGKADLAFRDQVATNRNISSGDFAFTFKDTEGNKVDLKQFRHKKDVVLVVMRGFPGYVCPYCSAQTGRFIAHYQEFVKRQAELLIVYPGPAKHISDFTQAARAQAQTDPGAIPFKLLLDEDFKVVERLGVTGDLAKPSTFILDKEGQVRFAYVGATLTDRPSLKAILGELDSLRK